MKYVSIICYSILFVVQPLKGEHPEHPEDPSQATTHVPIEAVGKTIAEFITSDTKTIIMPYECQPFQNKIFKTSKKINSKIKTIGYVHAFPVGLPTPAPIVVIRAPISLLVSICFTLDGDILSTFKIFPLKGRIA